MPKKKLVVVIGAGIAGLATAHYFPQNKDYEVLVVEKESYIGGLAHGFDHVTKNGEEFHFDFGPHKIYTEIPGIVDEMSKVTSLIKVRKFNSIFLKGSFYDFPLKLSQIATRMPLTALRAGIDILLKPFTKLPDDSYENFLINRFGKTLYNLSFRDYSEKVWNTPANSLDKELAIRRVAVSNIFQLIKGVLLKNHKEFSAEFFHYPPEGLFQLSEGLAKSIESNGGKILRNTTVSSITIKDKKITSLMIGKKNYKPSVVISTIFPDYLLNIINDSSRDKFVDSVVEKLRYQPVSILYIILKKERALKDCWIFFPEKKYLFQRVSEQKAFSPRTCPEGMTGLMVETTKQPSKENINLMIKQLEGLGILKRDEVVEYFTKTGPRVYPVYYQGFLKHLNTVLDYIDGISGLYTIGRPGRYNYNNTDHSWDMALQTYNHIINCGVDKGKNWELLKSRFDKYRIVD